MIQQMKTIFRYLFGASSADQLFDAIKAKNHQKLIALILTDRTLLEARNYMGNTPLVDAVLSKNYEAMRLLIRHGADVNVRDEDGWTAKSWAVFIQDKEAQRILSKVSVLSKSDNISGVAFGATVLISQYK